MGDIALRGNRLTKKINYDKVYQGAKDLVTGAKKVGAGAKDLITSPLKIAEPSKRIKKFGGGRTNLLEELGRVDSERAWTKHGKRDLRLEKHRIREELKKGGKVKKDKKWIQKVNKSIKARGTKGKCTPITKPGCTGRAKALAKTFKKMAAKRKAKG